LLSIELNSGGGFSDSIGGFFNNGGGTDEICFVNNGGGTDEGFFVSNGGEYTEWDILIGVSNMKMYPIMLSDSFTMSNVFPVSLLLTVLSS
jgi:hypothetical protein